MINKQLLYFNRNKAQLDGKKIEMRIELDSWSPVYVDALGRKYREKIAPDAFDKEIEGGSKINSYLDHKMSIEYLLASTKNGSLVVEKKDKTIFATFEVDNNNPLHLKVAKWIEEGVVESNSFIFNNVEYERINHDKSSELDYELIFTKGQLLSIDPVYEGFYSQDTCRVYSKNENERVIAADFINKEERMQQNEAQEIKTTEQVAENQNNNQIERGLEMTEKITNIEQQLDKLIAANEKRNQQLREMASSKSNVENEELSEKQYKELRKKAKLSQKDKIRMFNKTIDLLTEEQKNEIRLIDSSVYNSMFKRSLDATTDLKGLALIENSTLPGILTEINAIFPEFTEFTQVLPLTGLDEISKSIYVPDKKPVTAIAEGAEATEFGGQTFKVKLKPSRYVLKLTQNNALTNGDEAWAAQIQNAKDGIYRGLRKSLYTGLFTGATSNFNANTYTGGFTLEAKRTTAKVKDFTFEDIEVVVKDLIAKYGDAVLDKYIIATHPDTLQHLELKWKEEILDARKALYDPVKRTYRGIQIIISDDFVDKTIETGKNVAAIFSKDALLAYGLTITVSENIYVDMGKDLSHKYVQTRGEIKLIDPHVNSRFIQVK
ncbi:Putative phage prohead protein [Mycoplasmopsis bovigenitalium 51080]|uniref:Putative phage prohead protein n=1 Tax=Mycoplasmopsis bovigenitalium 51080 TaxID=1188235 RepID=N9V0S8_9BACT|nr:phage prohead protein [Mycoplasmopsis bovigenitalium]ENY69022.1 Putative phage prohead protein [Mycoplasmopsis bovigenitalium 51080]